MKKNITMRDIAKELNKSTVTVSKALSGREGVSEELREIIKVKAQEMGYRYNSAAKSMKEGVNYNIGILVSNKFFEDNSFYSNLYRHIVLKLNGTNFFGILEILTEEQELSAELPAIIENNKIDGLIVMGEMSKKYLKLLKETEIPYVLLDFYNDSDMESIVSDNIFGCYMLTNYLIQKGHREIAFVGNIYATSSIMDRYLGTLKSLLQHHIPFQNEWLICDRDEKGRFIKIELPRILPTAFVCNCDQIAYTLIQQLKEKGYRVPEDISVVGFDDYIYSTISKPQLTTYRVDVEQMAVTAVKSIVKKIKNPDYKIGRKVVCGKVIIRDSVADIKQ
ncbi:LacI family DNA-binding transcriptional regulator [Anaerosacchariphilus polymeriproducens]|uniref:LacI family transcriptional regulator n=1 Tax=Anaerosacchariphilus polymeriproducens TaxID=1812858 RepID=A0A371AX00_9FIRM|nr:LacI family DNA-binding transcriptional regulator [Anaerosacchariphilus polymeriproducens]RDU24071.1 LacI family transcriptional regulator [Anaerosacchariphilus polymeriproducens]